MSTALNSAKIALSIAAQLANPLDLGEGKYDVAFAPSWQFSDGTGAKQAKEIFTDIRTLAASGNETLDLAGGLTDVFGNSITFTKIKAIAICAAPGNTNDVIVGGAASNGFTTWCGASDHTVKVKPGGAFALMAPDANGYAVTAATGDLLKIANSAGGSAVSYTIVIIGVV